MPLPHEAILGFRLFLSTRWCISPSLVAFGHSWYREMHQLVLRKSLTLELPHVEKIHFTSYRSKSSVAFDFFCLHSWNNLKNFKELSQKGVSTWSLDIHKYHAQYRVWDTPNKSLFSHIHKNSTSNWKAWRQLGEL